MCAHYGACDIASARPVWTIKDEQGRPVASGKLPAVNLPTGKLTSLGAINASLAKAAGPAKLTVTVALQGTEFANDWEIWVYPAHLTPQPPADVVVTKKWDTAKAALAEGKKVVLFALSGNTAKSMHGGFLPVFWSPVWFPSQKPNTMGLLLDPKHPLFAQFPTEGHSNWQWYELMQRSRLFILDDTAATYRPTLQVIDNFARNHKLGVVFEGRVGKGQLLVCGFDLPAMTRDLAARQFLASLYAYLGSPAFRPAQELGGDFLEGLFVSTSKLEKLHAHIRGQPGARLRRRSGDRRRPRHDVAHPVGRRGAEVPTRAGCRVSKTSETDRYPMPAAPGRQPQRLDQKLRCPRQCRRQGLGPARGKRRLPTERRMAHHPVRQSGRDAVLAVDRAQRFRFVATVCLAGRVEHHRRVVLASGRRKPTCRTA